MAPTAATRRVLLLDLPRLLADLVRDALAQDDELEVVGDGGDWPTAERAIADTRPDVVVVGGDDEDALPGWYRAAFSARPGLRVFALTGNGARAALWELAPRRTPLGELSPSLLLAAMHEEPVWSRDA